MSADDADDFDLSYKPGERIDGHINVDVADTDIGLGAYLMKILGLKTRLYGNAFMDLHLSTTNFRISSAFCLSTFAKSSSIIMIRAFRGSLIA